jgi:hypothetical protein
MTEAQRPSGSPHLSRRNLLRWGGALAGGASLPIMQLAHASPAIAAESPFAVSSDAAFFAAVDLQYPGLESVSSKVKAGDLAGAKQAYVAWVNSRSNPRFFFSPSDRTSIADALNALDSVTKQSLLTTAEDIYNYKFTFEGTTKIFPNGQIVWTGPGEWPNILNRLQYCQKLAFAYYLTGDVKYVTRCDDLVGQWIAANPVVSTVSTNPGPWRALEAGIRVGASLNLLGLVAGVPEFTPEREFALLRSLMEHGRFLADWMKTYQAGNWQTVGATSFGWLGIMTPDWLDGPSWRQFGLQRIEQHLVNDTNADGFQIELSTGYHQTVMTLAAQSLFLDKNLNGGSGFGAQGMERLNGGFNVIYQLKTPNGITWPLGDAGNAFDAGNTFYADEYFIPGALLFDHSYKAFAPETASANFVTSFGVKAKTQYDAIAIPEVKLESTRLPATDLIVMRSGSAVDRTPADDKSLVSLFDNSIHGIGGHSHPNRLQFLAYAHGRTLLIDPSRGPSYNDPLYTSYYRTTHAHNVAQIDSTEQPPYADKTHVGSDVFDVSPSLDYARGHLLDVGAVDQSRQVVFIKGEYWIVRDRFTSSTQANTMANAFASSLAKTTWPATNLIDGISSTVWSSARQATSKGDQWAAVDIGRVTDVGRMTLSPRVSQGAVLGFPSSFTVQSSVNALQWADVPGQNYTAFANPVPGTDVNLVFSTSVRARYIRIRATEFRTDDGASYYMQLAEIRLPGVSGTGGSQRSDHRIDQWWHFWPGDLVTDGDSVRTSYPDTANVQLLASSATAVPPVVEQGWVTNSQNINLSAPAVRFTQTSALPATIETVIYPDPAHVETPVRLTGRIVANGLSEQVAVGLGVSIGARQDTLYFSNEEMNVTFSDGTSLRGEFVLVQSDSRNKQIQAVTLRGLTTSAKNIGIQLPSAGLATIALEGKHKYVYDFTGAAPGAIVTLPMKPNGRHDQEAHLFYKGATGWIKMTAAPSPKGAVAGVVPIAGTIAIKIVVTPTTVG